MTVAAGNSLSSSFSSQLTYSTSSSSSNTILSRLNGGDNKSLKRKRPPSHYPQLPPDYLTRSRSESCNVVVKVEEQVHQYERSSIKKRQQKPLPPPQSLDNSSRLLTLHCDAGTTILPQASTALRVETSYSKSTSPITTSGQAPYKSKEQGTQTGLELPASQAYLDWDGRGRSPFKTPAIAAIDGLKTGAKLIEWLD